MRTRSTVDTIEGHLEDAHRSIAAAQLGLKTLEPPIPPPATIPVSPGTGLQAAIDDAPAGATLVLADGQYEGAITIEKRITLQAATPAAGRGRRVADLAAPRAILIANAAETVHAVAPELVTLQGLGITNRNADGQCVTHHGIGLLLDRCALYGDASNGLHRGLEANGKDATVIGCLFDNMFTFGRDGQSIAGWNGTSGLVVDNCTLRGGTEVIMLGGADSSSEANLPRDITITNCYLTQNPQWFEWRCQLKNAFELKAARNVHMNNCRLEYAGTSAGQAAYLFVITVRNQSGGAPWSTIENVLIENCLGQIAGGGINFLGVDDLQPSGVLSNVTFRNVHIKQLSRSGLWGDWTGSGRAMNFAGRPELVTIDGVTFEGDENMNSLGYFSAPFPVGLVLRNINYATPPSVWQYGWKIDGGAQDVPPASTNIQKAMPDLTYEVTADDPGAQLDQKRVGVTP